MMGKTGNLRGLFRSARKRCYQFRPPQVHESRGFPLLFLLVNLQRALSRSSNNAAGELSCMRHSLTFSHEARCVLDDRYVLPCLGHPARPDSGGRIRGVLSRPDLAPAKVALLFSSRYSVGQALRILEQNGGKQTPFSYNTDT